MPTRDLIVLTADLDAKVAIEALLSRPQALGIRPVAADCQRFSGRDPGCRTRAHEFLRPFLNQFDHALVVFDRHGCGDERPHDQIEAGVEMRLSQNGWLRCAAVVTEPELETWIWSPSPVVDAALGWSGRSPSLRAWLTARGLTTGEHAKPSDPKRAMLEALREVRRANSASVFAEVAEHVSVDGCMDPAFQKLVATLRAWFS